MIRSLFKTMDQLNEELIAKHILNYYKSNANAHANLNANSRHQKTNFWVGPKNTKIKYFVILRIKTDIGIM